MSTRAHSHRQEFAEQAEDLSNDEQNPDTPGPASQGRESSRNNGQIAGFVTKLLSMVMDASFARIIHWKSENSFEISDPPRFAREVLPKFFKHNNLASFIRQLNLYGFKKVSTQGNHDSSDRLEFQHEHFRKNRFEDLVLIERRKNIAPTHGALGADKIEREIGEIQQDQTVIVEALHQLTEESRVMREALIETNKRQEEQQQMLVKVMSLLVEQVPSLRDTLASAFSLLSQPSDGRMRAADILTASIRRRPDPPDESTVLRPHPLLPVNSQQQMAMQEQEASEEVKPAVEIKREPFSHLTFPDPHIPMSMLFSRPPDTNMVFESQDDQGFGGCDIMMKSRTEPFTTCMFQADEPDYGGMFDRYEPMPMPQPIEGDRKRRKSEQDVHGEQGQIKHSAPARSAWKEPDNDPDDQGGNILLCC